MLISEWEERTHSCLNDESDQACKFNRPSYHSSILCKDNRNGKLLTVNQLAFQGTFAFFNVLIEPHLWNDNEWHASMVLPCLHRYNVQIITSRSVAPSPIITTDLYLHFFMNYSINNVPSAKLKKGAVVRVAFIPVLCVELPQLYPHFVK